MNRCVACKNDKLASADVELERRIAGRTFKASVPAKRCPNCGEEYVEGDSLGAFELAVAEELARNGPPNGDAFRFMRKSLGLPAVELAALMDVAPETVSRWENDRLPVERRALALLEAMVVDRIDGRTATLDRLRALRKPGHPPKVLRLKLARAG